MSSPERVHTVWDYWDGPRAGVADFGGRPHAYECIFDETADDWTDLYRLKPLTAGQFDAVMRDWAIWLRWKAAFDEGTTTESTHPALPEDAEEHQALSDAVAEAMRIPDDAPVRHGSFRKDSDSDELQVQWSPAP